MNLSSKQLSKLKTPLRYPGGKSRAMAYLYQDCKLPDMSNITEYRDPFMGGGSPSLAFSMRFPDIPIHINDKFDNLYYFWISLRDNGKEMHEVLTKTKVEVGDDAEPNKILYKRLIQEMNDATIPFDIGWRYYALNKMSFSGLTGRGMSYSSITQHFNLTSIDKLLAYSNIIKDWKITNDDYNTLLDNDPSVFVFLDPPYDLESQKGNALYGKKGEMHKGFNHEVFYKNVSTCNNKCMITYNSDETLRERFNNGKWIQEEWDLTYTMKNGSENYEAVQKSRMELLLTNYYDSNSIDITSFMS